MIRASGPAAWLALLTLLGVLAAGAAGAGSEEYSTFDVFAQEEDDESLLDHLLNRPPASWRRSWETSTAGLRSAQGCLTSGQWFVATDLRTTAPLGERARLGVELRDQQSDRSAFTYFDFAFRFPTRRGTPGFWFRPFFDKSRQDLGLFWEAGAETADAFARLTFGLEDVFNNLWEFRQARVGETSEPYERHPFEPAIRLHLRRPRWRVALDGQYLTPSRKRVGAQASRRATLWGAWAAVDAEVTGLGATWSAAAEGRQARSRDPFDNPLAVVDVDDFRRQWRVEVAAARPIVGRWESEARWLYQQRDQRRVGEGQLYIPEVILDAQDRTIQVEVRRPLVGTWIVRAGAMVDRISVAAADGTGGATPGAFRTYGSRTESRAYLGVAARFGRVFLAAVEGFELDREPYEVWWVHDKAFLQLQTTF